MKATINNLNTNFSICTYVMFTGDSTVEMETEYYSSEEGGNYDSKDIDFTFDHKKIVEGLSKESIRVILDKVGEICDCEGIINDISFLKSYSPQFYNYTTDSYDMEIDFDAAKLRKYVVDNDLMNKVRGTLELWGQRNEVYEAMLCVFLNSVIDTDAYNYPMWDAETEIYMNNMEVKLPTT